MALTAIVVWEKRDLFLKYNSIFYVDDDGELYANDQDIDI